MHMTHTLSVTVSIAEACLSCGPCHLMLQSAKGTFFFSVSSQDGRRSTSCCSSIERWCWVKFTLLLCRIYAEWHSNDIHSSPVLNGLLPLGCSKSRPKCLPFHSCFPLKETTSWSKWTSPRNLIGSSWPQSLYGFVRYLLRYTLQSP